MTEFQLMQHKLLNFGRLARNVPDVFLRCSNPTSAILLDTRVLLYPHVFVQRYESPATLKTIFHQQNIPPFSVFFQEEVGREKLSDRENVVENVAQAALIYLKISTSIRRRCDFATLSLQRARIARLRTSGRNSPRLVETPRAAFATGERIAPRIWRLRRGVHTHFPPFVRRAERGEKKLLIETNRARVNERRSTITLGEITARSGSVNANALPSLWNFDWPADRGSTSCTFLQAGRESPHAKCWALTAQRSAYRFVRLSPAGLAAVFVVAATSGDRDRRCQVEGTLVSIAQRYPARMSAKTFPTDSYRLRSGGEFLPLRLRSRIASRIDRP